MGSRTGKDYIALNDLCDRIKRNDPSLVGETCSIPVYREYHLRSFMAVLPTNHVVTSLSLDVTRYSNQCDIQTLLKYLSETKLIQSFSLTGTECFSRSLDVASRLLGAVAENAQLALVGFTSRLPLHPHVGDLLNLLQSKASSLTDLTLQLHQTYENRSKPWSDADGRSFADAVGRLTLLQSLILEVLPNPELTALTLQPLRYHACLRKLSIVGYEPEYTYRHEPEKVHSPGIIEAVSLMLQSGVPLEVLELNRVSISKADMERLVRGLEVCPSLVELSLNGFIKRQAAVALVRCLRASRTFAVCGIRRLCLGSVDALARPHFASLLSDPEPATTSMLSSLEFLNLLHKFEDIGRLLKALVMGRRLSSLSIRYVSDNTWPQLNFHLPNLLYLNELSVKYVCNFPGYNTYSDSKAFIRAIRNNGCLNKVFDTASYDGPLFTSSELQRIQLYCERNAATRDLLQNPNLYSGDDHGDETKTPLYLFPKLFEVMKPARRMSPNYILMGLLACDSCDKLIGPCGRFKRVSSRCAEPAQQSLSSFDVSRS
jgi:hypothetical protein